MLGLRAGRALNQKQGHWGLLLAMNRLADLGGFLNFHEPVSPFAKELIGVLVAEGWPALKIFASKRTQDNFVRMYFRPILVTFWTSIKCIKYELLEEQEREKKKPLMKL